MNTNHLVNTKEPYRIDVHHHVMPAFYLEALERIGKRITFGIRLPDWSLDAHPLRSPPAHQGRPLQTAFD